MILRPPIFTLFPYTTLFRSESVVIANGRQPGVLDAIFASEPVGTLFLPHGGTVTAWKRWLGYTARPKGKLVVDAGARSAVDRKSTRLNSSHANISYAVFCLK